MGESSITLGWNNFFGEKTMKKMNIFEVNGVWQLGRPNDEHEQEHEDIPLPKEHVAVGHPQPEIPHDSTMLTQIWGGGGFKIYMKISTLSTHVWTKSKIHFTSFNSMKNINCTFIVLLLFFMLNLF